MKEKDEKGTLLRWLFPLELFPFDRNDRWAYIEINQLGIKKIARNLDYNEILFFEIALIFFY